MKLNLSNFQDVQQQGGMFSSPRPDRLPIANAILGFIFFIVSVGAYPAKLFFRENMGERNLQLIHPILYIGAFFYVLFWTFLFHFLVNGFAIAGDSNYDNFMQPINFIMVIPVLSFVFIIWVIRASIRYFKKHNLISIDYNTRRHSQDRGTSKYFQHLIGKTHNGHTIRTYHIQAYFEPLITLYFGAAIAFFDLPLAVTLAIAGGCLFIDEWQVVQKRRDLILDTLDSEMDAIFLSKMKKRYREIQESDIDIDELETNIEIRNLLLSKPNKQKKLLLPTNNHTTDTDENNATANENFDIIS